MQAIALSRVVRSNRLGCFTSDDTKDDLGDDPVQDATYPDPLAGGYKGPEDCGKYAPAKVISTSYGYNEADLTPAYEARQCQEYMKLGMIFQTPFRAGRF